jgi:hypothetical protein
MLVFACRHHISTKDTHCVSAYIDTIVYPDSEVASKTGRRPATFLPRSEWREAGQWLESAVGLKPAELLNRLLDLELNTSYHRLRSYFNGDRLPEPFTLRAICDAGNVSYVEAIDRFGYYREIVRLLDDMVWLGGNWLEADAARGGTLGYQGRLTSALESLGATGVLYWKDRPITWGRPMPGFDGPGVNPNEEPSFFARYTLGSWRELAHQNVRVAFEPIEVVPGATFSLTLPARLEDVAASLPRETLVAPERIERIIVPKPVAVALLLAVIAFPIRGDAYKSESIPYRLDLGKAAGELARTAGQLREDSRLRGRPKKLHPLLQRAIDAMDDRNIPFDYRRPIAADYVVIWATSICRDYTHFARLAAYEFWGDMGGRAWDTVAIPMYGPCGGAPAVTRVPRPSTFTMMPQVKLADLPDIESLTTTQ